MMVMTKRIGFALLSVAMIAGCERGTTGTSPKVATNGNNNGDIVARPILAANLPGGQNPHDWLMWGRTPSRNMVTDEKGVPTEWDVEAKTNIKWVANLGSQSYGNPVVT